MMETIKKTGTVKQGRPGGRELAGRKIIRCPHCREMLMDLDKNEKVELFKITVRKSKNKPVRYKETKQCAACSNKVGYNLITAPEST
jgi:hypothetical protein